MLLKIKDWLQNLFQFLESILRVLVFSRKVSLPKRDGSNDCVILGNGPSLTDSLLHHSDFLRDKDLIVVNFFANSPEYEQLKPKYYMLNPIEYWLDEVSEKWEKMKAVLFENILTKTTWNIYLFIPVAAKKYSKWKKVLKENENFTFVYFNQTPFEGFPSINKLFFKWNLGMPRPHNVLLPSLMVAINMRFERIYLLGADHSWLNSIHVTDNNEAVLSFQHFYDTKKLEKQTMKTIKPGEVRPLHMILHKFMLTFKGYFEVEEYSKKLNSKIYNATPGSYIDAFERIKLNEPVK